MAFLPISHWYKKFFLRCGFLSGNEIRGAEHAVRLRDNARVRLAGNTFNANHISVFSATSANPISLGLYRSRNNNFNGDVQLPPAYPNMPSVTDGFPEAGVFLNDVISVNLGLPNNTEQDLTDFYFSLEYGIRLNRVGNALIEESRFDLGGYGIYATASGTTSILNQIGLGSANPTEPTTDELTFNDVKYPIFTSDMTSVSIRENEIFNSWKAIEIQRNLYSVRIMDNTIFCADRGLELLSNDPSSLHIQNNGIFMDNTAGNLQFASEIAINCQESGSSSADNLARTIAYNNIHLYDNFGPWNRPTGIFLNSTVRTCVYENTITLETNQLRGYGIRETGGDRNHINDNIIEGVELADGNDRIGISIEMSTMGKYECNTTDKTKEGMVVHANCSGALIKGNIFGDHATGLKYSASASTNNTQDNHGNRWTGTYTDYAADNDNPVIPNAEYLIAFNQLGDTEFNPSNISPTTGWFGFSDDENANTHCQEVCSPQEEEEMMILSSQDSTLIEGDSTSGVYVEELIWMGQRELYGKINESMTFDMTGDIADFYDEKSEEAMGQLHDIEQNRKEYLSMDASSKTQIQVLSEQNKDLSEQIGILLLTLDSLDGTDSIMIEEELLSLGTIVEQNTYVMNNLYQVHWQQAGVNASWISQENGSINISAIYEYNEKRINDILSNTLDIGNHQFSSTEMDEIIQISNQCPLAAGKSVYRARTLRITFDPETSYDDDANCEEVGLEWRMSQENTELSNGNVSLFPNPARDYIHITSTMDYTLLKITDISGKHILQYDMGEAKETRISTSQWMRGIYFIEVYDQKNRVNTLKLVIN
ncbi:MAG: hypothetical protein ACI94Y_000015 [Maribacter sp.]